ncbi:MAG TPA: DEDD exonuclease domain-containing protein, partial [Acidimicrobiales bacterium]|nr:DEDD exonuclease domain-containing protein [Acidimicrobiales bacterium]
MQRSFDDLGTPLHEVTFVVVDLETTGTAPAQCAITEVGAVKMKGGVCLGKLQTLVNPGAPIPPAITYLTGITEAMVLPAPPIEAVLPSLLEFVGDAVVLGHNVRFDLRFLQAALERTGRPALANRWADTCGLARRLVGEEVRDCRLSTLAQHFGVAHRPTHRALDDALATADVFHCLLERAASFGVLALDDLLELPTVRGHPMVAKLRLAARLPRRPGVYLFRDGAGRVLYVGRAVDLRRRVRSYFSGPQRRKVGQMLRELHAIDHVVCSGELEAAVLEVRLIHQLQPRFNRQSKLWPRYAYLKLTLDERFPRLSVVRSAKPGDGCLYLGPLPSAKAAGLVAEAIESAAPLRRCKAKPGRLLRSAPCAPAQLGVATCPCAGDVS